MQKDNRNIIDYYKYWKTDAIKADLDSKRNNFSILISNDFHDFNIGSVIRNANAFLASQVIIVGKKQFDRRGTVGTHTYENMKYVSKIEEFVKPNNSILVGVDNIENSIPVETFDWPKDKHVIMAFGQEQVGLTQNILEICDHIVYIKQYGSVRSLNVGCASAIIMYDYCKKNI